VPGAFVCCDRLAGVDLTELLFALVILVGLIGIVVPVLPGSLLILGAALAWAAFDGSATAWSVLAVVVTILALGAIVKYVVPGRRLAEGGVPRSSLVLGGLLGIVGFFLIPVVGLVVGFVLGVYLGELRRLGAQQAWPSTRLAVRAVGLSVLIELAAGLLAAVTWAVGASLT
jgi:uncharacterized protein YqgC (DUF456 family)